MSDNESTDVIADEQDDNVNFFNVFMCYYKNLFGKEKNINMFHDIDYSKDNSTNRCMEFFYSELHKYQEHENNGREEEITIYEPDSVDLDKCDELYVLMIDNEQNKMCQTLLPLIKYVSTLDWLTMTWRIDPFKAEY